MAQDTVPTFVLDSETSIKLDIAPTQALTEDQGYTYNQAGFTYNQAGVMYGGVYNQNQDVTPVFFNDTANLLSPSISAIIDVGTHPAIPPGPNYYTSVGPGFWMFVTYSTQ